MMKKVRQYMMKVDEGYELVLMTGNVCFKITSSVGF